MKRVMIIAVLGVVCAVLAAPVVPMPYDPSNPPPTPYANIGNGSSSGDETGWNEPVTASIIPHHPWNLILQQNAFIRVIWDRVTGADAQSDVKTTNGTIQTTPRRTGANEVEILGR
jgi:hypothetical protein